MASGGDWWVVYTYASPQAEEAVPHVEQSATEPKTSDKVPFVLGPYKTKAQAEAAIGEKAPPPGKFHGHKDKPPGPVGNVIGGLTSGWDAIKVGVAELSDGDMWRSLGWLALGLVLMFVGLRMWLGKPALPKPPPVVPIPV
jgi:hypothetical protein